MLTFEGRRVPEPLQKVVQNVFRFWIAFLTVFGTILDPQMIPKWHQGILYQELVVQALSQGVPKGARGSPRHPQGTPKGSILEHFETTFAPSGLYFGACLSMLVLFWAPTLCLDFYSCYLCFSCCIVCFLVVFLHVHKGGISKLGVTLLFGPREGKTS